MPNFTNFNQSIINLSKFINEYLCSTSDELIIDEIFYNINKQLIKII